MPLDFDYSAVPDAITRITTDNGERTNPVTNALAMATQIVGIRTITEANAAEFYARLHFSEMHNGALLISGEGPQYISAQDVRDHIGLTSNANTVTDAAFRRTRMAHVMEHLARSYTRSAPRADG